MKEFPSEKKSELNTDISENFDFFDHEIKDLLNKSDKFDNDSDSLELPRQNHPNAKKYKKFFFESRFLYFTK